ncbi:MAG: DNA/RNA nuclease SfsA [Clostridia bacterium]|jgi:sugar fermentation stimulation protein A|nr:DNA/RNA nuclease SfsA [Clostridia bacterium]
MKYQNIKEAKFLSRPNRFIAQIEIDGNMEVCHVKNTGRCRELLIPGADIFVRQADNPNRKTKYDLIGVYKGDRLVNIDSQVVNQVFHEWVLSSNYFPGISLIKPEYRYKHSRFDFYLETEHQKILVEVKGVTLEEGNVAMFPDAPTERGVKHINELVESMGDGYQPYIAFIIQMKDVAYFTPNGKTHREFADALKAAAEKGVKVLALDCIITPDSIVAGDFVPVRL